MKSGYAKRQHGAALLAMLAILALGASWYLVSRLNADSGVATATRNVRNAEVLNSAKQALIAYVAMRAAEAGEDNPGRLACPEAAGNIGGTNEGVAAGNCTLPAIGRFPWRTFGTDTLVDATSEPLWYVVSPGWALSNSTTPALTTYINSNSTGQLLVNARSVTTLSRIAGTATAVSTAHGFRTGDSVKIAGAAPAGYNVSASVTVSDANTFTYAVDSALSTPAAGSIKAGDAVVALIVAPGTATSVAASANCTARNQARSVPTPTINPLDYLECYDAANGVFSTSGSSSSFNDQVLVVTAIDIMPAIEAAIAQRIEREIVPVLKTAYVGTKWNTLAGDTVFPFAASFLPAGNYQGAALTQGLLPFSYSPPCSPVGDPRCTSSTFHAWGTPTLSKVSGSGSLWGSTSCSVSGSLITCTGFYQSNSLQASLDDPVSNVANALRDFDLTDHTVTVWTTLHASACNCYDAYQIETSTLSRRFNNSGSLSFIVRTPFRWASGKDWGYYYIEAQRPAITDHPILSASTGSSTGWFARNEWYRLLYYAVARGHTAEAISPSNPPVCPTTNPPYSFNSSCLSVANVTPAGAQRAILILGGRSVNGTSRPSATLADYLESGNATGAFTRKTISAGNAIPVAQRFNDRVVVIGSN